MAQSQIRFELFAPYNDDVKLVGSWNDWQPIAMRRNDTGYWQAEIPLDDGCYEYQFDLISKSYFMEGQRTRVPDPTAIRLTQDVPEHALITIKDGKKVTTTYAWKHGDHPLPPNERLIMYELHLGDFYARPGNTKGCFLDAIDKLDYLVELGINAI